MLRRPGWTCSSYLKVPAGTVLSRHQYVDAHSSLFWLFFKVTVADFEPCTWNKLFLFPTPGGVDGTNPWESITSDFPCCFHHALDCQLVHLSAAGKPHQAFRRQDINNGTVVKVYNQRFKDGDAFHRVPCRSNPQEFRAAHPLHHLRAEGKSSTVAQTIPQEDYSSSSGDFMDKQKQLYIVRVDNNTSCPCHLGPPQGCVLGSLIYTLFTHNCFAKQ